MNASPIVSPATQSTADVQDTHIRKIRTGPLSELAAFESMLTGAVHLLPSKVTTLPLAPSTAAQKLCDEHDTDAMPVWVLGAGSSIAWSRTPRAAVEQKGG
jgi:hypothetical protein